MANVNWLPVVVGRLDPFHNQSCKPGKDINNDNIFRRFNVSYGDLVSN